MQALCIVECGVNVVNGTWAYDHQQAIVFMPQDFLDGGTGIQHGVRCALCDREFTDQLAWRQQFLHCQDTGVIGLSDSHKFSRCVTFINDA
jgi:hypothetical protein